MAPRPNSSGHNLVTSALPFAATAPSPTRQWRILWNYPIPPDSTTPFTGSYYVGMNTDGSSVVSFEYGTVTTVETVPANTSSPNKIGAADVESNVDQAKGIITIVVS